MLSWLGVILCGYGLYIIYQGVRELMAAPPAGGAMSHRAAFFAANSAPAFRDPQTGGAGEFALARPGAFVRYRHPVQGEVRAAVQGSIQYIELWQRRKGASEPWVPTGNRFTAHWLDGTLLYAWKGRLWLLDEPENVTDVEIKQHFLQPAKRFGASDETARVNFAYPPGSWLITDIGKFRVQRTWGSGLRLSPDATGRFIHASGGSGLEGRALVVEDYLEGHGGQDTVWRGWEIGWDDVLDIQ